MQEWNIDLIEPAPELEHVQRMLPISDDDRERLRNSILLAGKIREPLSGYTENGTRFLLLAGRTRWEIANELLKGDPVKWGPNLRQLPVRILDISDAADRLAFAIRDNLDRRHFSQERKRSVLDCLLKNDPSNSDRSIAKMTGSSHRTVSRRRKQLELEGEISPIEKLVGRDGKQYRRRAASPTVQEIDEGSLDSKNLRAVNSLLSVLSKAQIELALEKYVCRHGSEGLARVRRKLRDVGGRLGWHSIARLQLQKDRDDKDS